MWLDDQCQHRCIWRDDELSAQTPLQREIGNTEAAILIGVRAVANVVRGFGKAPRDPALCAILDMAADRALVSLAQECRWECAHHERGHEILEHAPAP